MEEYNLKIVVADEEALKRFRAYFRATLRHEEIIERLEKDLSDEAMLPIYQRLFDREQRLRKPWLRCVAQKTIQEGE